jgi:hypothetical protein
LLMALATIMLVVKAALNLIGEAVKMNNSLLEATELMPELWTTMQLHLMMLEPVRVNLSLPLLRPTFLVSLVKTIPSMLRFQSLDLSVTDKSMEVIIELYSQVLHCIVALRFTTLMR